MRKIMVLVSLFLALLILASCSSGKYDKAKNIDKESRFVDLQISYKICDGDYIAIRDTKTNIIYISSIRRFDMSVLYNQNGEPYTYDEFVNEYNQ